eukprot:2941517-Amphidinium_carterae.1
MTSVLLSVLAEFLLPGLHLVAHLRALIPVAELQERMAQLLTLVLLPLLVLAVLRTCCELQQRLLDLHAGSAH